MGVGVLLHKPVEIVVTDRSSRIPVVASPASANEENLEPQRHLDTGGIGNQHAEALAGREVDVGDEGQSDSIQRRRLGRFQSHRATLVTGGATLGAAGTLLPAMVVHGSAQLALATGAGALLGLVVTRVADLATRGKKAS